MSYILEIILYIYSSACLSQGGDLCSRLEEAEKALALKQDLIDKLKEEVEQQKGSLETVPVLTAQVKLHSGRAVRDRSLSRTIGSACRCGSVRWTDRTSSSVMGLFSGEVAPHQTQNCLHEKMWMQQHEHMPLWLVEIFL